MPKVRQACAAYKDGVLIGKYRSHRDAATSLGIHLSGVTRCIKGIRKSAKGYTFADIPNTEVPLVIDESEHEWRSTHIFPNEYKISDDGQLYSICNDRLLKYDTDHDGYTYYTLCVNGNRKSIKTHRLVAEAFIPNPENKPAIDHINGNRADNRVENLRWVTNKENTHNENTFPNLLKVCTNRDFQAMGTLRDFGRRKILVYNGNTYIGKFNSQRAASKATGVSEGKVSECVNRQKSCKGYTFRLLTEKE